MGLAETYDRLDRYEDSSEPFIKALPIFERTFGPGAPRLGFSIDVQDLTTYGRKNDLTATEPCRNVKPLGVRPARFADGPWQRRGLRRVRSDRELNPPRG